MSAEATTTYAGPLSGVRIVDLTRILAGPYATMLLADMGAEVMKVEEPEHGDSARQTPPNVNGVGNHFLNLNRNKKSIAIDLKRPEGRDQLLALVRNADVVVENFRPGVLARLGLQYDDLRAVNEQIILCSISGFGQDSSYRDKPSYDVITQAMSGAMSVTGEPGRPPVRLGIPMGDLSGGLFGALAILAALNERRTTGRGQALDVSMLDGLVHLMLYYPVDYLNANKLAGPVGGRHEHVAPYGVFATSDGYIVLAIFSGKFWRQYCQAVERPDLPEDERFLNASDRLTRRVELYEILDEVMLTKTTAEWEALMDEYGVPHSPILTVDQVAIHPLMREREMFVDVDHPVAGRVKVSGRPIKFHERQHPMQPAPLLGQHTREVLAEVAGTPLELIEQLERDGVIASVEVDVGSGPVSEVRA